MWFRQQRRRALSLMVVVAAIETGGLTTLALAQEGAQTPPETVQTPQETAPAEPVPSAEELEQRIKILERKLELEAEAAADKEKTAPRITAGPEGFGFRSAKGDFALRLRGYVQLDGRGFQEGDEERLTDTFVVRRARPIVEGTLYNRFDFKFMPDFGGGTTVIQEAYLEARLSPRFRIRAGKFKSPVGLERLQSAVDLVFVERATPTAVAPNRDVGVQLGGDLAAGQLEYAVGVFNGAVDGGMTDLDAGDDKDLAGRLFWRPFRAPDGATPAPPPSVDLGIGIAATHGEENGTVALPALAVYRSSSQTFFSYRTDATALTTAVADGARSRLAPQVWLYAGSFGVLAELVTSRQDVRRGAAFGGGVETLETTGWLVEGSWVLTGESPSFRGVAPRRPWVRGSGGGTGTGAWILSARISGIDFDDAAFPTFADPARSVSEAMLGSVGVSWNPVRGVRWLLDYTVTEFEGGSGTPTAVVDRRSEKAIYSRLQMAF